jgi:TRAP-type C4-dicarboxylate transport system permease small subunit
MDHQHNLLNPVSAMLILTLSFISAVISWVNLQTNLLTVIGSVKEVIGYVAAIVSITAGCMAVRYYYYATKKIKKESKNV